MGVCWNPSRGHLECMRTTSPALLHPYLASEMAISERTINFLYLINPVNPRSFTVSQKVCSARVTPSFRLGGQAGAEARVGIPWAAFGG